MSKCKMQEPDVCNTNLQCDDLTLCNSCFYIQSCNLNECETNYIDSSIIAYLSFVGADQCTDTYYVTYYFINPIEPPSIISGVANKVQGSNQSIQCVFNDGSQFNIVFADENLNIGQVHIVTHTITGSFCLIGTALYAAFYSCGNCEQQKLFLENVRKIPSKS